MVSLALIQRLSGLVFGDIKSEQMTLMSSSAPGLLLLVDTSLIQNSKQLQEFECKTIKVNGV